MDNATYSTASLPTLDTQRNSFGRYLVLSLCLIGGLLLLDVSKLLLAAGWLMFMLCAYGSMEEALLLLAFLIPIDMQRTFPGSDASIFIDLAKPLVVIPFLLHRDYRRALLGSRLCQVFLATYLVTALMSVPRALDVSYTMKLLLRQFSGLSFGLIVGSVFQTSTQLKRLFTVVFVSAAINGAYAIVQMCLHDFGALWKWINPEIAVFLPWEARAAGFTGHPNALGVYMVLALCLTVPLAVGRSQRGRFWVLVGAVFIFSGILCSLSRSAFLATVVAATAYLFIYGNWRRLLILMACAAGLFVAAINSGVGQVVIDRATKTHDVSEYERLLMWGLSFNWFLEHPLFGIGYGNWGRYFASYISTTAPELLSISSALVPYAHNIYLQVLSESGICGFILVFGPLGFVTVQAFKLRSPQRTFDSVLRRSCGVAVLVAFTLGMLEPFFDGDQYGSPFFWILIGVITFQYARRKMQDPPCESRPLVEIG